MPEKIHKGISYTLASQVASMGLQFGLSIILARGLGSDAYGLYGVVQNAILTISWILDLGGSAAVTKYIADYEAVDDSERATSVLASTLTLHTLLILLFWLILLIFQNDILRLWFDNNQLLLILFALSTPMLMYINDLVGALYGFRELKYVAIRMFLQNFLIVLLNLLCVWYLKMGVQTATAIYFAVLLLMLITLVGLFRPLFRDGRLINRFKLQIRQIILFSLPIGGLNILEQLIRNAPVLLVKALGAGDPTVNHRVASLSLAILLSSVAETVVGMVIKSGSGYMAHWLSVGKKTIYITFVFIILTVTVLIYGVITVLVFFGMDLFVSVTYGNQYEAILQFILLTLMVSAVRSVTMLLRTSLYTMDLSRKAFLASFIEFILYIVMLFLLTQIEVAPDWSIRLLQVSLAVGSVKVVILLYQLFRSFRDRFDIPLSRILKDSIELITSGSLIPRKIS